MSPSHFLGGAASLLLIRGEGQRTRTPLIRREGQRALSLSGGSSFLGKRAASPFSPATGLGECCKLPSGVRPELLWHFIAQEHI